MFSSRAFLCKFRQVHLKSTSLQQVQTLLKIWVADADEIKTVGGSPITVEQLDVVRSIDDVILEAGTIDISDGASAIIAANDASLNSAEIGTVTVYGAPVTASTGATLNGMTKAVVYNVEDQAKNIYDNHADLDEATNIVVVSGGDELSVAQAEAIQGLAGYQGYSSSFSIDDTAANIISAGDSTLTNGKHKC